MSFLTALMIAIIVSAQQVAPYLNMNALSEASVNNVSELPNYVETSQCVEGEVVYEGNNDYYIIITQKGCTIVERYSGRLDEGDKVRGELNKYKWTYIYNRKKKQEVKIYIEDYMLSERNSLMWMGKNKHLKSEDQKRFDSINE